MKDEKHTFKDVSFSLLIAMMIATATVAMAHMM